VAAEAPGVAPELTIADPGSHNRSGPAERFWGRAAFVPDWSRGEEIDAVASADFLARYWPQLRPSRYERNPNAPVAADPHAVRVFRTDYWDSLSPSYRLAKNSGFEGTVKLYAAQGESEPFALGIRSDARSRRVSVTATDFAHGDVLLNAGNVSNRLMLSYSAREAPGNKSTEMLEKPMVLLKPPGNEWAFPPATTMSYIVDFHVPATQPPGDYRGEIAVAADGIIIKQIPVSLTVLPFRLLTNNFHAGAFGTTYDIWAGGFSGYTEEMIEMDSRYGFNLAGGFFNKGAEIPFVREPRDQLSIDEADPKFAKFDHTMKLLRRYGMGDVAFWNWGATGKVQQFDNVLKQAGYPGIATNAGKRGFAKICAALKRAERRHNWPEFVINPFDEALKDQDGTRAVIEATAFVQEVSPATRLYMTEWRPGYTRLYQSSGAVLKGGKRPREREMRALKARSEAPRLNFAVIGSNTLSAEARQLQNELGGELWHYGGASQLDATARMAYGFIPWIVHAEAALIWANYKGDFLGNGWTLHFAMPLDPRGRQNGNTRGPIIPSVRAVAVREGIDDRKYIETLRYHATIRSSADDLRFLEALGERANKLLANTDNVGGIENVTARFSEQPEIEKIRAELRARIVRLVSRNRGD
jgi:hypothetical protein